MITKLLNRFKKNNNMQHTEEKPKQTHHLICINGQSYAVQNDFFVKLQEVDPEKKIYGWSLEFRWRNNPSSEWSNWEIYWNKIVYQSRDSALTAAVQASKSMGWQCEWRVKALYAMTDMEFRDYKISQVLSTKYPAPVNHEKPEKTLKAWILKEDYTHSWTLGNKTYSQNYKKGMLFMNVDSEIHICATPTKSTWRYKASTFEELQKQQLLEEIDILKEKKYHPHLIKEVKQKLKIK